MSDAPMPAIAGGDPVLGEPIGYGGQTIGPAEKSAVLDVLDRDLITRGPEVESFEADVAGFVGVDHAIAVSSGTAALHIAGLAAGIEEGDQVVTTPLTFTATANAACHAGGEPVFADVDPDTRNLDPASVAERITEETSVLLPMHYAGQPCEVDALMDLADDHDLTVIWDACHAFGSRRGGRLIGAERDMAVFSFHPVKNITTGEGGMVVTDRDDLAEQLRSLRSFRMTYDVPGHADEPWYQVTEGVGFNYNVTDIQAAIGRVQLDRIHEFKDRRDRLVARYNERLSDLDGLRTPTVAVDVDPMWHLYAVEIAESFPCDRGEFVRAMHAENVLVQVHYVPLTHHPHFREAHGASPGDCPTASALYGRLVSLPLFPGLSNEQHDAVIRAIERIEDYYSR